MFEHDWDNYPELTNNQLEVLEFVSPHPQIKNDFRATVVRVIDGDTVVLAWKERDFVFPLRLLHIDAPELNEPNGHEVGLWLEARILQREVDILIEQNNRVDKYGRLLGSILHNGINIGYEMLQLGLAVPFEERDASKLPDLNKLLWEGRIDEF